MKKKDSLRSPQQGIKNKLITLRFISLFFTLLSRFSHHVVLPFLYYFCLFFLFHSNPASLLFSFCPRSSSLLSLYRPPSSLSPSISIFISRHRRLFLLIFFPSVFNPSGTPPLRDAAKKKQARERTALAHRASTARVRLFIFLCIPSPSFNFPLSADSSIATHTQRKFVSL